MKMATWNYRPCRVVQGDKSSHWEIKTVYYNDSGDVEFWSEEPALPIGDTIEELQKSLNLMISDFHSRLPLTVYRSTCSGCNQDTQSLTAEPFCSECRQKPEN